MTKKKSLDPISIAALVVSILSLISSVTIALISNKTASDALNIANQANDIALGKTRIFPVLSVSSPPSGVIEFKTEDAVKNTDVSISLFNRGDVPIDQVTVQIIGLSGEMFAYEQQEIEYQDFDLFKATYDFGEQLAPQGQLVINLKVPVLQYLARLSLGDPSYTYRGILNIVFLPRQVGEEKPIQTPGNYDDRFLLSVEFSPQVINSLASYYAEDVPVDINIFNYSINP
jgi:hypothetical protein